MNGSWWVLWSALIGCGLFTSAVEEPPVPEPVPPPSGPAPKPGSLSPELSESERTALGRFVSADHVEAIAQWRRHWTTIATDGDFKKALPLAVRLSDELEKADIPNPHENTSIDLSPLDTIPGLEQAWVAEGTELRFWLRMGDWRNLAKRTEGEEDDAYTAMMMEACEEMECLHYPKFVERTWDYGGCSKLGSGTHLKILVLSDKALAAGRMFAEYIQGIRDSTLGDIREPSKAFPYCAAGEFAEPFGLDKTKARNEVRQILDRVNLSTADHQMLVNRLSEGIIRAPSK